MTPKCSVKYSRRIFIIPVFSGAAYGMSLAPIAQDADKVYLISSRTKTLPKTAQKVYSQINEDGRHIELKLIRGYMNDLYYAIGTLRKIIESESGNYINIELTQESPIWVSAVLIAAMLFSDEDTKTEIYPYYLSQKNNKYIPRPSKYRKGIEINPLPVNFRIEKPSDEILDILMKMVDIKNKSITITKKILIEVLESSGIKLTSINENDSNNAAAKYNALQRRYIKPLTDLGYITQSGSGKRPAYSVTESGMNALHAFVE